MSNADKKRAENLANLFGSPAPATKAVETTESEPTAVASAVGVMGKVISIAPDPAPAEAAPVAETKIEETVAVVEAPVVVAVPAMEPVTTPNDVAPPALASVSTGTAVDALVSGQVIEQITTPLRLSGVTRRQNVQVPAEILNLLREVDKKLATSGRPVVSRNALLAMAAARVIANPSAYENRPVEANVAGAGIQARLAEEQFVALRAAAYSTDVPLVTTHAMALAVQELLMAAKKGLRK
jgi:hypothetical protein